MKIAIIGCAGRMGRTLVQEVHAHKETKLMAGVEQQGSVYMGKDIGILAGIGELGIAVTDDTEAAIKGSDAIIDFTQPDVTMRCAELAVTRGTAHVIGTTGLSEEQMQQLRTFAKKIPIVYAPNMSIGVNVLLSLVEKLAAALDDTYDIEIVEMHHRNKVDAPSGTALALGNVAAAGRKVKLEKVVRRTRDGYTGIRPPGEIGFATLRGGDVVGEHTVIFAGNGERIELTHKAASRVIFARGALRAALWTKGRKPGFYTMQDVLEI